MTTRPPQDYYGTDQAAINKMEEVFNSDDNEGGREGNGYEANPYDQYINSIKNSDFTRFKDLLNAHPEYSLRIDPFSGQTPIFEIVQVPNEDLAIEMLKCHKAKDGDLAFKDKLKQNIIFYIARDGKTKLLDYVVSEGVSIKEADSHNQTPLYYAAREGHNAMCKRLIELGLNPNHSDIVKQTCLFYGAKAGHLETCKLLVENGAKYDHNDKKKQTPLFWAKKSGNKELIDYLESLKNQKIQQKEKSVSESKSNKKKKSKDEQKFTYNLVYTDENGHRVQMTKEDFQRFIEEHPHLAEYFQNPAKLPIDLGEKGEKAWEKAAKKILQTLWKMRGAYHFHAPVDPVRLNCLDYFDIIKNPMDFGTAKSRLNASFYENCSGFLNDMKLVFSNCILYNGAESEIGLLAQALEKEFDRLCRDNQIEQYLNEEAEGEGEGEGEEGEGEGEGEEGEEDAEGRSEMRDESRTEDHRHEHASQSHVMEGERDNDDNNENFEEENNEMRSEENVQPVTNENDQINEEIPQVATEDANEKIQEEEEQPEKNQAEEPQTENKELAEEKDMNVEEKMADNIEETDNQNTQIVGVDTNMEESNKEIELENSNEIAKENTHNEPETAEKTSEEVKESHPEEKPEEVNESHLEEKPEEIKESHPEENLEEVKESHPEENLEEVKESHPVENPEEIPQQLEQEKGMIEEEVAKDLDTGDKIEEEQEPLKPEEEEVKKPENGPEETTTTQEEGQKPEQSDNAEPK